MIEVRRKGILLIAILFSIEGLAQALNPIDMRWTFGAHEPYVMYRRIGVGSTGGIDGNAEWVKPWLDWFDSSSPELMHELGLNWLHCRFYKGMGWEAEKEDFKNVKRFVDNCHKNGVHALAYVQFGTLYPEIMKSEIPDVGNWAQVNSDGKPNFFTYDQYFRHMPCINCKEWEEYIGKICEIAVTEGGFDGIMFDNVFSYICGCERCEKSFSEHLSSITNPLDRFGYPTTENIRIPKDVPEKYFIGEVRDPVIQAWIDWRVKCTTELIIRLRDRIKKANPEAVIAANIGAIRRKDNPYKNGVDTIELSDILDITVAQGDRYPSYKNNEISSRIRDLKICRDLGKVVVALCDVDASMTAEKEKHYLLPLYEDLVFGGVPTDRTILSPRPVDGFIDKNRLESRKPLLASFNRMINENRDIFDCPAWEPVRIFFPEKQLIFSRKSDEAVIAAEEILTRRQIPWGYFISTPAKPFDVPEGTEVIVVPGLRNLTTEQVDGLVGWAKNGGKLVITGDSGRYNAINAQRFTNPLLNQVKGLPNVVVLPEVDFVNPADLDWAIHIGAPSDHGDSLVGALFDSGLTLPFTLMNCPEYVAMDARKTGNGYVLHFVNYNPSVPVKRLVVRDNQGRRIKVDDFDEYTFVRL